MTVSAARSASSPAGVRDAVLARPKLRLSATAPACRAIVAARLEHPGSEWAVFRALQTANFTSPLVLEDGPAA